MTRHPVRNFALVLLLATVAGGCATSGPFKMAASLVGPGLADNAQRYVERDADLATLEKATRIGQAAALRDATAVRDDVDRPTVEQHWYDLRGWYAAYIDADAVLTPREKLLRQRVVAEMDHLIANDGSRPLAQLSGGSVPNVTALPVVTPTPVVAPEPTLPVPTGPSD